MVQCILHRGGAVACPAQYGREDRLVSSLFQTVNQPSPGDHDFSGAANAEKFRRSRHYKISNPVSPVVGTEQRISSG